jgi:hypothetical protein
VPSDPRRYRVAIAESCRRGGIPIDDCTSAAHNSLIWDAPDFAGLPALYERHCAGSMLDDLLTPMRFGRSFDHPGRPVDVRGAVPRPKKARCRARRETSSIGLRITYLRRNRGPRERKTLKSGRIKSSSGLVTTVLVGRPVVQTLTADATTMNESGDLGRCDGDLSRTLH